MSAGETERPLLLESTMPDGSTIARLPLKPSCSAVRVVASESILQSLLQTPTPVQKAGERHSE